MNLVASFKAWITCSLPPWTEEALEAAAEAAAQQTEAADADKDDSDDKADAASEHASTSSSIRSARELGRQKRKMMAVGLAGTYVIWVRAINATSARALASMWGCEH